MYFLFLEYFSSFWKIFIFLEYISLFWNIFPLFGIYFLTKLWWIMQYIVWFNNIKWCNWTTILKDSWILNPFKNLECMLLYRFHKCLRVQKMSLWLMSSLLINMYEGIYSCSNQTAHNIACALHISFMVQKMILQFISSSSLLMCNMYERIFFL